MLLENGALYHISLRILSITTPTFGDLLRVHFNFQGDHVLSIPVRGLRSEEVSQSSTSNQSSLFDNRYHSNWSFACHF